MGPATLALEPEWVAKWSESYNPVFIVLVKVPSGFQDLLDFRPNVTSHRAVAFGKRFDPVQHQARIKFTKADRLTAETLYDWREQVYAHHERGVA